MWMAAKKHGEAILEDGMFEQLSRLKKSYKLAIFSGVRTDIISGMLQIAGIDVFDFILGQPPVLGLSNDRQLKELREHGRIAYVIGDKRSDMDAGRRMMVRAFWF